MNRRQRKKHYLEEFSVKGFEFSCKLKQITDGEINVFYDTLIDLAEKRNLTIDGGGSEHDVAGYVSSNDRYGSATEEDIAVIKAALEGMDNIEDIKVAPLSDAYYGENLL
jgi:uncharacterized protein YggL (DUF469 family)